MPQEGTSKSTFSIGVQGKGACGCCTCSSVSVWELCVSGTKSLLEPLSLDPQGELKKKVSISVFSILVYLTLFVLTI